MAQTELNVTVRIDNPSPSPLTITGSAHKLRLNGEDVGTALSDRKLTVPALSFATQPLTFHVNNLLLFSNLAALVNSTVFSYELESTLYQGAWRRSVSIRKGGRLELQKPTTSFVPPASGI